MTRMTISLPEELAELVTREARRRGETVSETVRQALRESLAVDAPQALPFKALGRSGHRHVARDAERILEREWGRARRR